MDRVASIFLVQYIAYNHQDVHDVPSFLNYHIATINETHAEKKEKLKEFDISVAEINKLRLVLDAIDQKGKTVANDQLTLPAQSQRSYAYCSDTNYFEDIILHIKEVDLVYH